MGAKKGDLLSCAAKSKAKATSKMTGVMIGQLIGSAPNPAEPKFAER